MNYLKPGFVPVKLDSIHKLNKIAGQLDSVLQIDGIFQENESMSSQDNFILWLLRDLSEEVSKEASKLTSTQCSC